MNTYQVYYNKRNEYLNPPQRTLADIENQYVAIIEINANGLNDVYSYMQAEIWQPTNEDIEFFKANDIHHASMSVDDIILDTETGIYYQVADFGFNEVMS